MQPGNVSSNFRQNIVKISTSELYQPTAVKIMHWMMKTAVTYIRKLN